MDFYLFAAAIVIILFGLFLYKKKWEIKHVISIVLSLIFIFLFSYYGSKIIIPLWPNVNAASFWVLMFFLIYGGGALMGCLPFILHRKDKKEGKKIFNVFKFWFAIGLIYVAIDNSTMGPYAVGPNSPYLAMSLCKLNPTYFSEDVFFGCLLEKVGINPYTELGVFFTYMVFTILLFAIAGLILGYRKLEKLMFID